MTLFRKTIVSLACFIRVNVSIHYIYKIIDCRIIYILLAQCATANNQNYFTAPNTYKLIISRIAIQSLIYCNNIDNPLIIFLFISKCGNKI